VDAGAAVACRRTAGWAGAGWSRAVIQSSIAGREWEFPAAGGSLLGQWSAVAAAVAPQFPDQVAAVAYPQEFRRLDLRPDSPAYATQVRLITTRIVAEANTVVGADAVRTVRVLPVGVKGSGLRAATTAPAGCGRSAGHG
jgi:hypothetical protein